MFILELVGVIALHIVLLQMHDIVVLHDVPELVSESLASTYSSALMISQIMFPLSSFSFSQRFSHFAIDKHYIMLFLS